MAFTETEISNLSLSHAKQGATIVNITDNNTAAKYCDRIYRPTLDRILAGNNWTFASTSQSLATLDVDAKAGFSYVYSVPSNCLQIYKLATEDMVLINFPDGNKDNVFRQFVSDDGKSLEIHSSIALAHLLYVKENVSTALLPPLFIDYQAWEMASELADLYSLSDKAVQTIKTKAEMAKYKAIEADALNKETEFDNYNPYIDDREV